MLAGSPKGGALDKTGNFVGIVKTSPFGRGGIAQQ